MTFFIRKATSNDFAKLYEIWMQDHVIPFMAFKQMTIEEFKPVFDKIMNSSEVYVAENDQSEILGVRKIAFGEGSTDHTVYLGAFAVNSRFLRQGVGQAFYNFFINAAKKHQKKIIEISQETNNSGAQALAAKMGYGPNYTACFPDWLQTLEGAAAWLPGEGYLQYFIDKTVLEQTIDAPTFTPALPELASTQSFQYEVAEKNQRVSCYLDDALKISYNRSSGAYRYDHIQFWTIDLPPNADLALAEQFLRDAIAKTMGTCKKIEIFSHDRRVLELLKQLGFHCRGQLLASHQQNGTYYNQTGTDFSLFNLQDAEQVLHLSTKENRPYGLLKQCQQAINRDRSVDAFGKIYLENLAFQMIREVHAESFYTLDNAPWPSLLADLSQELPCKPLLVSLAQSLNHIPKQSEAPATGRYGIIL